jgi:putative membrane protein
MEWRNLYRGLVMGAVELIPGISSGTIAVILGIYERLIAAINGLFSKEWKKHLSFLIPLGIGIVSVMFLFARLIEWLFENYPSPTQFFFLGLIVGILPYLFNQVDVRKTFKMRHYLLLIAGAAFVASLNFLNPAGNEVITDMNFTTYALLFFSGFIGSAAMVLPGISGAFVLMVMGVYYTMIGAISNLLFDIILVTGFGIAIGIIVMSKIIYFFLNRYHSATFALVIGFVIGSTVVLFPGWEKSASLLIASAAAFAAGLFVAYILGRVEHKA